MAVEYREEPCRTRAQPRQGNAVRLVAEPVHGLRPPLHVLLRPGLRAAGRPPRRRSLRAHDPRQAERRRRSPRRARPPLVGARGGDDRRRHRSVPARRRALPPHPRVHRRARAGPHPHLDHHPRPARLAGRRRAPGGRPAGGGLRQRLGADARRPRLAHDRAGHGAAPQAARDRAAGSSTRASARTSRSRRSCPVSPTGRSSSPRPSGRRARQARTTSGPPSSTSDRARASTSSRRSPATGPRRAHATSGCTRGGATSRRARRRPCAPSSRALAREHASDGRPALRPPPGPTQLTLV